MAIIARKDPPAKAARVLTSPYNFSLHPDELQCNFVS
jgi:hypothetical protein